MAELTGEEFTRDGQLALDGDRHASVDMWARVAKGEFDFELRGWLQHVATAVVDAESKDAGRQRDAALVRALGLAGKGDKHRDLREFVSALHDFEFSRSQIISAVRTGALPGSTFVYARFNPQTYEDLTDGELGKLIDRQVRNVTS